MTDANLINRVTFLEGQVAGLEERFEQRLNRIESRLSQIENDVSNKADTYYVDDQVRNVRSDLESLEHKVDYS